MFTTENLNIEIKIFLAISILCAVVALFIKTRSAIWFDGLVGLGSLIAAYLIFREKWNVELEAGGYLSVIGFILILSDNFMPDSSSYPDEGY